LPQRYRLYGLDLDSTIPIPAAMTAGSVTGSADLRIRTGRPDFADGMALQPMFRSADLAPNGLPMFQVDRADSNGWVRWSWSEGVVGWVDPTGATVFADWPEAESVDSVTFYLVGPLLAYILRLRGVTLLHGSVVTRDGVTLALVGDSGAGKSTLAAALVREGFAAVTDDVIALTEGPDGLQVEAGYAGLRLWPEAADGLGLDTASLPRLVDRSEMWPDWDKRLHRLHGDPTAFASGAHRLTHVHVVCARIAGPPRLETLASSAQLMDLDRNAFQRYLRDDAQARRDLAVFARLAGQAKVRRLHPSDGLDSLGDVVRLLVGDAEAP
jgi:hypothetical protein